MKKLLLLLLLLTIKITVHADWIRINQLGYTPAGSKVAVWCSKEQDIPAYFELVDAHSGKEHSINTLRSSVALKCYRNTYTKHA